MAWASAALRSIAPRDFPVKTPCELAPASLGQRRVTYLGEIYTCARFMGLDLQLFEYFFHFTNSKREKAKRSRRYRSIAEEEDIVTIAHHLIRLHPTLTRRRQFRHDGTWSAAKPPNTTAESEGV